MFTITVIVATVNRPASLKECISSVLEQTYKPIELILVDAGNKNRELVHELLNGSGILFTYVRQEIIDVMPRKTAGWNTAVKIAKGNILVFLDDDEILEKYYFYRLITVYDNKDLPYVGGVGGIVTNEIIPYLTRHKFDFGNILRRFFLLPGYGTGRVRSSGFPSYPTNLEEVTACETLGGGNMSFRKEVFNEFQFDEWFKGYSYMEDDDFTFRVSRKYKLYQTPFAKMIHKRASGGRGNISQYYETVCVNHYYFFKKNMPKNLKTWLSFLWSEIGRLFFLFFTIPSKKRFLPFSVIECNLNVDGLKGYLKGWYRIVKTVVVRAKLETL